MTGGQYQVASGKGHVACEMLQVVAGIIGPILPANGMIFFCI